MKAFSFVSLNLQVDYLPAIDPQNYTFDTLTEKVKESIMEVV